MPMHEAPALPAHDPPPPPPRRPLRALSAAALGLLLAAATAEGAFRWRDRGAFPLVNVYEADPARGVRLRPGAVTQVARPGGEATVVRVNESGYRGPSWPPPSPGEVLVVGDSQAFGLGVDEGKTLASALRGALKDRSVIDASVPTYGPLEYLRTLGEVGPSRRPSTVVVVLNPINDLFEVDRPGPDRYGVVDGWAVRREALACSGSPSPLRQAAIERSHAAFALWRLAHERAAGAIQGARGPSWPELVSIEQQLERPPAPPPPSGPSEAERARERELAEAEAEAARARRDLAIAMQKTAFLFGSRSQQGQEWRAYAATEGEPPEQVFELYYGGCAPPPGGAYRYRARFEADRIRGDVEGQLLRIAADPTLRSADITALREALARRDKAAERLAAARLVPAPPAAPREPPPAPPASPLAGFLEQVSALSSGINARLLVVMLPLALETSTAARAREGAGDEALGSLGSLRARVLREAEARGAVAIDPLRHLTPLGDEGFQPDGHLSAEGHRAVALAVTEYLSAQLPPPEGRLGGG